MKIMKQKKGSEGIQTMLTSIGLLLISAIVIVIFVMIAATIFNIVSKSPGQGTQESFHGLVNKLEQLENGNDELILEHAYYIQDNFFLLGFNKDPDSIEHKRSDSAINKENNMCSSGEACVCLCNNKRCEKEVVDCNMKSKEKVDFDVIESFVVVDEDGENLDEFNQGLPIETGPDAGTGNYLAFFGKWGRGLDIWKAKVGVHSWGGQILCLKREGSVARILIKPKDTCQSIDWQNV
jgi:hypothetical protein